MSESAGAGLRCPLCGELLVLAEYPDTGTDIEFYEGVCSNRHKWEVQRDLQTEAVILRELEDESAGAEDDSLDDDYADLCDRCPEPWNCESPCEEALKIQAKKK